MDRNVLLLKEMIRYYARDPKRIQHFIKVHDFAGMIGKLEGLEDDEQNILEIAAIVHDIGIKVSEEKYGDCSGKHQELEGPVIARTMLEPLGFEDSVIDRVCYLVAHHHTYQDINGLDYQILVEADFLVNYFEDHLETESIKKSVKKIFKTETGIRIATEMFFPEEFQMSDTWAQDGLQELDDFIEAQGIYIRQ